MVCISCIVIPVVLWLWHRFLQPVFLKFWNPWQPAVVAAENQVDTDTKNDSSDASSGKLKCPFTGGGGNENPHTFNQSGDMKPNESDHVKAD